MMMPEAANSVSESQGKGRLPGDGWLLPFQPSIKGSSPPSLHVPRSSGLLPTVPSSLQFVQSRIPHPRCDCAEESLPLPRHQLHNHITTSDPSDRDCQVLFTMPKRPFLPDPVPGSLPARDLDLCKAVFSAAVSPSAANSLPCRPRARWHLD